MPKKKHKRKNKNSSIQNQNVNNINIEIVTINTEKKSNDEKSAVTNIFAFLSIIVFIVSAVIGAIIFGLGIYYSATQIDWHSRTILDRINTVIWLFIDLALSVLLLAAAIEMIVKKERDKQFVVSMFSALVSFTALIVAVLTYLNIRI